MKAFVLAFALAAGGCAHGGKQLTNRQLAKGALTVVGAAAVILVIVATSQCSELTGDCRR